MDRPAKLLNRLRVLWAEGRCALGVAATILSCRQTGSSPLLGSRLIGRRRVVRLRPET